LLMGGLSSTKVISLAAAAILAAVLLYYSLRGIDWRQVWILVVHAKLSFLALCALIATVALLCRAVRWRILLNAEGQISVPAVFWATAAGLFGNNFLPARGGELVRTFMISRAGSLPGAYVLATALSERLADAMVLVIVGGLVLVTLPEPAGWLSHAARPFAVIGIAG